MAGPGLARYVSPMDLNRRIFIAGTAALLAVPPARAGAGPLHLRAADAELALGGIGIRTAVFNDLAAAPLIEARRGEPLTLAVENTLAVPFRFQPHGLRGQAVTGHKEPIAPGEMREIVLTPPDAGTFVYRAAAEGSDPMPLLSGPLLVSADEPPVAHREVLIAINTLIVPDNDPAKPAHRQLAVNGSERLDLSARPGERLRLRIINLSREMIAGAALPHGAVCIAVDGQPCEPFPPLEDKVFLPPLGRADLVLGIPSDARDTLTIRDALDPDIVLANIAITGETVAERYLAPGLPANPALPKQIPFEAAVRAKWSADDDAPPDPLLRAATGESVVLTLSPAQDLRALLIEGHSARVLDGLDDGWKGWWVDTHLIHPDETARLAFTAGPPGRYTLELLPLDGTAAAPQRTFIEIS